MGRVVTLTTDFGTADGYVGEMKGVLLSLAPDALIVDITHDIPPQDIDLARLTVSRVWRRFPTGTTHLVVVDPDVGSSRAALAVESAGRFLVGPDNGILSAALMEPSARVVRLATPGEASATFHGRDVFAPAAAALARGDSLDRLGAPFSSPAVLTFPEPVRAADGSIEGDVLMLDRFGNAITNLPPSVRGVVQVARVAVPVRRVYADVAIGDAVALVGSYGSIEIAVRNDSAARVLGISRGDKVILRANP